MPQIYNEAQRNGNRISDARVLDIINRTHGQASSRGFSVRPVPSQTLHFPISHSNPAAYTTTSSLYGGYSRGKMMHQDKSDREYRNTLPINQSNSTLKRQAAQILGSSLHAPASKRLNNTGSGVLGGVGSALTMKLPNTANQPCIFFSSPSGCRHGASCGYSHDTVKNGAVPIVGTRRPLSNPSIHQGYGNVTSMGINHTIHHSNHNRM